MPYLDLINIQSFIADQHHEMYMTGTSGHAVWGHEELRIEERIKKDWMAWHGHDRVLGRKGPAWATRFGGTGKNRTHGRDPLQRKKELPRFCSALFRCELPGPPCTGEAKGSFSAAVAGSCPPFPLEITCTTGRPR